MDYDNDGILDFISGSYDPGDVYLFRGLGKGKYGKQEALVDENDVPLVHHPVEMAKFNEFKKDDYSEEATQYRVASFGSWVAAADWDADEDLDMLIGSFSGGLFLRENIGTREEPKYSGDSIAIKVGGKALKENCHAAPVVADWDGDGVFDLVVGSGDGSVGWYKNIGSVSKPEFGPRNLLVSPAYVRSDDEQPADQNEHGGKFLIQKLNKDEVPSPGARAQICVCDYNQDGALDLIVGDYSDVQITRELSKKEQQELDALELEQKALGEKLKPLQEKLYGEASKELDKAEKAKLEKEYQSLMEEYMKLDEKRPTYFAKSGPASFVWLYLRKSDAALVNSNFESENPSSAETEDASENENATGPVSFDAMLKKVDGKHQLHVEFNVKPKWHLYADSGSSGSQEVSLKLELPNGVTTDGEWENPATKRSTKSPGQKLYKGHGLFKRNLKLASNSNGEIKVEVAYQVCNQSMCMPPMTKELLVKIK